MRRLFIAAASISALFVASALAQSQPASRDAAELLKGNWRMTSLEQEAPNGELAEVEFSGQIIFTEPSIVAVQAMNIAGDSPENPYSVAGYEAYYGSYAVSETGETVTFTVEASVVRDLIGQDLERAIEISDDRLVITPTNPEENWRVTYERY